MKCDLLLTDIGQMDKNDFRTKYVEGECFGDVLINYMSEREMIVDELSELTEISSSTIARYRNNSVIPSIRTLTAICVALHLHINRAECLMKLCGYRFNASDEHSLMYTFVCMSYCSDLTVEHCNRILMKYGYKELTVMQH